MLTANKKMHHIYRQNSGFPFLAGLPMPTPIKLIFVSIGLLVVTSALWLRHMNRKSAVWLGTEGTIIVSLPYADPVERESHPLIEYRYAVAGKSHTSRRVSFATYSLTQDARERLVAAYPVGQTVRVHYNPHDPAQAVLERSPSLGWLAGVAVGLVFVALGLLLP
jgi:hypothetical protein